ncbi:Tripartite motif-containing protein 16-like [Scleropages formosus]|uniref:Tripartite motif-containing protein 16-like n=1 Tax=Scleropages formosus TaxID=113540 RepID=A0A0P7UA37_SCLFO|nr:Tripartite motif-containing protein 16-like [Scleropages formosus]
MASEWSEEFSCPVCLETLHDPATLPCGHTFCLPCIQKHWDRGEARKTYSCPQCRQTFNPRPVLSKSTLLVEAMEKLKLRSTDCTQVSVCSAPPSLPCPLVGGEQDAGLCQGGIYPKLPVTEWLCADHGRPLELFCRNEQQCICSACRDHEHKDHQVVSPETEKKEKVRELAQMQADTQRKILEKEKQLQILPLEARAHKDSFQVLQRESSQIFAELVCSLEQMSRQVTELLCNKEAVSSSWTEVQIQRLEQEMAQLRSRGEELSRLTHMQNSICFLKNFLTLEAPLHDGGEAGVRGNSEATIMSVRTALGEFRDRLKLFTKRIIKLADALHSLSVRFVPTLDHNTAYRHLRLTEGNRKASLRAESQAYPEHPERFQYWRQILCQEPLAGSPYYWEVEWSGQKVTIGVAYRAMGRKGADDNCRLGYNDQSWGLYWSGTSFSFWHLGKEIAVAGPKARRLGMYLDQQAGVLAFYRISKNQAHLLHRVQESFLGPLYPGFRFGSGIGASVTLCELD